MNRAPRASSRVATPDVDDAVLAYERELITLGRLAELLDIDRDAAIELLESRGVTVVEGAVTKEEAREEVRALERLRAR